MSCFKTLDSCKKTAKGVQKTALQDVAFDAYKNISFEECDMGQMQYSIVSSNHELFTKVYNKITLSSFFDKKFTIDKFESRSYDHFHNEY